ncbi:MAG: hypothetical protein WC095_02120 [Candidatus Paceibacterota bacterium]
MNTKKIQILSTLSLFLFPLVSYAALEGLKGLLVGSISLINLLIKVFFGLGLLLFFWGAGQFILHSGEDKARTEGRNRMIWGIIALFVMASIYGILGFIGSTVGISPNGSGGNSSGAMSNDCLVNDNLGADCN